MLSHVRLFATPWTVAHQAPPSMGFSRQEYWSGLPFPSPGDLPDPGIEPRSPSLQADALPSEPPGKPAEAHKEDRINIWKEINLIFSPSSEMTFGNFFFANELEKEMATHSSILAWKIPWMEEPGRLQSMGSRRVGHDCATSLHFWWLRW